MFKEVSLHLSAEIFQLQRPYAAKCGNPMKIGKHDAFERQYVGKFRALASQFGEFVEYERDRAVRDIGIHLISPTSGGGELVSPALVWFQLKGIHKSTLPKSTLDERGVLSIKLQTNHLRFWYVLPEPTYLAVFVEAVDKFFVLNIKTYVNEKFGDEILQDSRKTIPIEVRKDSELDRQAFYLILIDNNVKAWKSRIHADEKYAYIFFRDADLIARLADAAKRKCEYTLVLRQYISKTRSEVYFLERQHGQKDPQMVRSHWQFMMPSIEDVFPYLSLAPCVDEDDASWEWEQNCDPEWQPIQLSTGRLVYPEGSFETVEYCMTTALNDLGQAWHKTLKIMEAADFIEIDRRKPSSVSVAPWHGRDV